MTTNNGFTNPPTTSILVPLTPKAMRFLAHLANNAMMPTEQLAALFLTTKLEEEATLLTEILSAPEIEDIKADAEEFQASDSLTLDYDTQGHFAPEFPTKPQQINI